MSRGLPSRHGPVERFRRVVAAISEGRVVESSDAAWFTQAAQAYLDDPTQSRLDLRLGLHPRWGERSWWTSEARSERDALLVEMDRSLYAGLDLTSAARTIVSVATQARQKSRANLNSNEREFLSQIASTGRGIPAFRQLRTILARGRAGQNGPQISQHELHLQKADRPIS